MTCSILFQGLTAHTHQCDVKRVFDLVLERVEDALLSCAVEPCNILEHMEPLSLFLNWFPAARSCEVRLHGRGPTDEWAGRRSAGTDSEDTRPCINTVTYTTVLKSFAATNRAEEVFSMYEDMKQRCVGVYTVSFNAMLDACAKCNAMHRAHRL